MYYVTLSSEYVFYPGKYIELEDGSLKCTAIIDVIGVFSGYNSTIWYEMMQVDNLQLTLAPFVYNVGQKWKFNTDVVDVFFLCHNLINAWETKI